MKKFKRICPKCNSKNTKKDWKRRWKQSYKCKSCNHVWIAKSQRKSDKLSKELYYKYVVRKQTYSELSKDYWLSKRKIQYLFDKLEFDYIQDLPIWKEVVLLIDTTYFGDIWLMVFKDANSKKILHYQVVNYETNQAYKEWVKYLIDKWVIIQSNWKQK